MTVVRNAKSEEKAQNKYEQQCWSKIESFYAQAEDFQGKGLSGETDDMAIQLSEDYESLSTEVYAIRLILFVNSFWNRQCVRYK